MVGRLEKEMEGEATEKAYCDEQMPKTSEKKWELDDEVAKMTETIDTAVAKSAELKEQVAALQNELPALAKEQ